MKKAITALAVILGLLGLAVIGGEFYARAQLQSKLELAMNDADIEASGLELSWPGLLLPQLLVGSISEAELAAKSVNFNGLEITNITAAGQGVSTSKPHTIESVEARGEITAATLSELAYQYGLPEAVDIVLADGAVQLEAELFGQKLRAGTTLTPGDREIGISVDSVSIGGIGVDLESWGIDVLSFFGAPTVSLDQLPEGLEISHISVEPSTAAGDDSSPTPAPTVLAITLTGADLDIAESL